VTVFAFPTFALANTSVGVNETSSPSRMSPSTMTRLFALIVAAVERS
jgi:hypothetical protein